MRALILMLKITVGLAPRAEYVDKVMQAEARQAATIREAPAGWEYRTVAAPGGVTHGYFVREGPRRDAPVLLCLHGVVLDGRTFQALAPLADRWTLIAYNFPEIAPDVYRGSIDDFSLLLEEFTSLLDLEEVDLAGVSFGGIVAQRFARSDPMVHVHSLILISSSVPGATERGRRTMRRYAEWAMEVEDYQLYWFVEKVVGFALERYDKESAERIVAMADIKHPAYYRQVLRALASYDGSADAGELDIPTLALHGEHDALFDASRIRRSRELLAKAMHIRVAGGDHAMALLEGKQIASYVRAFCTSGTWRDSPGSKMHGAAEISERTRMMNHAASQGALYGEDDDGGNGYGKPRHSRGSGRSSGTCVQAQTQTSPSRGRNVHTAGGGPGRMGAGKSRRGARG